MENTDSRQCQLDEFNDDSSDNEDDDSIADEEIDLFQAAKCLFCEDQFPNPNDVFSHCQLSHGCGILGVIKSWKMDSLSYIRFINYIRREHLKWSDIPLKSHLEQHPPWQDDKYLQPVLDDDGLLQFDVESFTCTEGETEGGVFGGRGASMEEEPLVGDDLPHAIYWQRRALAAEKALEAAVATIEQMRSVTQEMFTAVDNEAATSDQTNSSKLQTIPADSDAMYFDSYGHHGIHQEMLQDSARTMSYKSCFYDNKDQFKDKVVLDVGSGTGILCMFAASAGAQAVVGVEMSDIIYNAMDIIRENGLDNKIKLVKGRMEDVDIGVDKVDAIVSEWMGYFLLFESMLDSVIYARDRYLKPGGLMLPNRVSMHMVGVDSSDLNWRALKFWDDVHGFRMTCMRNRVLHEAGVALVSAGSLITSTAVIKELDTSTCTISDLDFESQFELQVERDGELAALAGYFDVSFSNLPKQVSFSTGPRAEATHWQQTVFLLPNALSVTKGQTMNCQLKCCKNRKDPRSLCVTIHLNGHKYTYAVD